MKIKSQLILGTALAMAIVSPAAADLGDDARWHKLSYGAGTVQTGGERRDPAARAAAPVRQIADRREHRRDLRKGNRRPPARHRARPAPRRDYRHGPAIKHRHRHHDEYRPLYFMLRTIPYLLFHSHYDSPYYGPRHYSGPPRAILSRRSIRRILRDYHFRHIDRIVYRNGVYIARARNHYGELVRVRIDPYTGEILRVRYAR